MTTGRPGDEELARALHHHVEVAHGRVHRRQPGDGAEHGRDDGHHLQELGLADAVVGGEVGAAHGLEGADAAAGGVEEADHGDAIGVRLLHRPAGFVGDAAVGRAAADGEVAAVDGDLAAVDADDASDGVGGGQLRELGAIPLRAAREHAGLGEAALVGEEVDALADGELAAAVVEGDGIGAAHLAGDRRAAVQLIDIGLPGHARLLGRQCKPRRGCGRGDAAGRGVRRRWAGARRGGGSRW